MYAEETRIKNRIKAYLNSWAEVKSNRDYLEDNYKTSSFDTLSNKNLITLFSEVINTDIKKFEIYFNLNLDI